MINANYSGGLSQTDPVALSDATVTDIHTDGVKEETCAAWTVLNDSGSAVTVSVFRNNGTTDTKIWKKSISANDTIVEADSPIKLRDGFKITAQASTGGAITITPVILRVG